MKKRLFNIRKTLQSALLALLFSPLATYSQSGITLRSDSVNWINVSNSIGFPLGGVGTGYSVFGRYGFVKVNFDGRPKDGLANGEWEYNQLDAKESDSSFKNIEAEYTAAKNAATPVEPRKMQRIQKKYEGALKLHEIVNSAEGFAQSSYGFTIADEKDTYILQTNPASWKKEAIPFSEAQVSAYLPKGVAVFTDQEAALKVTVNASVPMIPHDLANSTLPVQVFEVTIKNTGVTPRNLTLTLENSLSGTALNDRSVFKTSNGEILFAADNGKASDKGVSVSVSLSPGDELSNRFYISWYFPKIDTYQRYYSKLYKGASEVIDIAKKNATEWNSKIDKWHNSIQAPTYLNRIWFGSLSSIMTSTIMTSDPYFFEIETPHPLFNTMDVSVYCGWVYMINWPELERMDMNQYFQATPKTGDKAGLIMHSLWNDEARYVEEPTFMCRMRRDALWYNDKKWTKEGFEIAKLAANRVYNVDNYEYLIQNKHGNQSYDIWRMPGVNTYVNSAWVYGLDAMKSMAEDLGEKNVTVANIPLNEMLSKALVSYDKILWNPQTKSWNLFFRTPGAQPESTPETLFTDQLFGLWVAAIDKKASNVLPAEKINTALHSLYVNNVVEDKAQNFRGWVNGMKANRVPDVTTGYHSRTCWFGPQINLSSLLGFVGDETASIDIMKSMDMSLKNNHLAAGEWNGSINAKAEVLRLPEEKQKDTPRFAPYPRYKSSWEYLIRLIGLQLDEQNLYLNPFKTVDFSFENIELAGKNLSIKVESGWNHVWINGKKGKVPVVIPRTKEAMNIEFLK